MDLSTFYHYKNLKQIHKTLIQKKRKLIFLHNNLGFSTTPVNNSFVVNSALNRLNKVFLLYPEGFFYEIKKGGIPLTIILINNYSDNSINNYLQNKKTQQKYYHMKNY